jgi:hypothetical protein
MLLYILYTNLHIKISWILNIKISSGESGILNT